MPQFGVLSKCGGDKTRTAVSVTFVPYVITDKKSEPSGPPTAHRKITRQIDTLQRLSKQERDNRWGSNWVQEMVDFFNLDYFPTTNTPSYRPRVVLPELQHLLMAEATELTNDSPKTYISVNGKHDEQREKAFAAMWKRGSFNNRVFDAVLWSQFCNPACLQLGFNAEARSGKGMVWAHSRDPETFYPDANTKDDRGWAYVCAEDFFYVDDIKRNWGHAADNIKQRPGYEDYADDESTGSGFDLSLELPPGPLRVDSPDGFEHHNRGPRERVRYLWVKDFARERVDEIAGKDTGAGIELLVQPEMRWKYPNGRFLAECQGWILSDGANWVPRLPEDDFATFPFLGVWSMPHPKHYFGVPPVRYGKGAQDISERMWTQLIENLIRLNNGQCWIPDESGIDIDAYGGMPGEVQVYRGEKPPSITWPNPIPQHMTQVPEILLQKVARYVGFTPERQGQAGQGNISPELFDAAVFQSQSILRMKARLLAEMYQRLAQMAFYMMVRFKKSEDRIRPPRGKDQEATVWKPIPEGAEVDMELDETSVDVLSSQMLKSLVLALGKQGLVPNKFILETLQIPNAAEIADAATKQGELAALSKLRRPR
jgi:hypothetical protein